MASDIKEEVIDQLYDQKLMQNAAISVDAALGRLFVQYHDMQIYEMSPSSYDVHNEMYYDNKDALAALGLVREAVLTFDDSPQSRQKLERNLTTLCENAARLAKWFSGNYANTDSYEITTRGVKPVLPVYGRPNIGARIHAPLYISYAPQHRAYDTYTASQLGEYTITPPQAALPSSERYTTNNQGQTVFHPETLLHSVNDWILSHETGESLYRMRLAYQFLRTVYQLCWIAHRTFQVQVSPNVLDNMVNTYNGFKMEKIVPLAPAVANRVRLSRRTWVQRLQQPTTRLISRSSSAPKNMEEGGMRSINFHNKGIQNYLAHGRSKSDTSERKPARRMSNPNDFTRSRGVPNEYVLAQEAYYDNMVNSPNNSRDHFRTLGDMSGVIHAPPVYASRNRGRVQQSTTNTARFFRSMQEQPGENQRALFLQSSRPRIRSRSSPYARMNSSPASRATSSRK